ncbi:MAG: HAD-IIA family hydrolase [Chloroflexota bacterium]
MDSTKIKALILDMDGVLWKDTTPIGKLGEIFKKILNKNLPVAFATNNSTKTGAEYVSKLSGFGVTATNKQIFTSATVTAQELHARYPNGGKVFVIGEQGLVENLRRNGFNHDHTNALAVVVGLDRNITYDKLLQATQLIRNGIPFIGTNPDTTYPTPKGLAPGAGSILASLTASSGVVPEIMGKPNLPIFEQALAYLETKSDETLMVGDRLDTDIVGGQAAGCLTALVLSGVSTKSLVKNGQTKPDQIALNLAEIVDKL